MATTPSPRRPTPCHHRQHRPWAAAVALVATVAAALIGSAVTLAANERFIAFDPTSDPSGSVKRV